MPRSHTFSRAWHRLFLFASPCSDWFGVLFIPVVVGQRNYFDSQLKTILKEYADYVKRPLSRYRACAVLIDNNFFEQIEIVIINTTRQRELTTGSLAVFF